MPLYLTSDDVARVGRAQSALLSPVGAPDAPAWGRAVAEALSALFHAEAAIVVLPDAERTVVTRNVGSEMAGVYEHFVAGPAREGRPGPDPAMPRVERARRRGGLGYLTFPIIDRFLAGGLGDSPFFNETAGVMGAGDLHGLYLPRGPGDGVPAQAAVYHVRGERSPFGGDGHEVLGLLAPAFEAGADALVRLGRRTAALDALGEPVAAYDDAGRTLHQTPAFGDALAGDGLDDAGRATVEAAASALARDLLGPGLTVRPTRAVRAGRGVYRLRAAALPDGGPFGPGPTALVTLVPPPAPWPEPSALSARFGLTRREAEVALLLARGLANRALADALCISPHTARRHTERVMAKLGVPSRTGVAAALLDRP